jgi:hypothetical protein
MPTTIGCLANTYQASLVKAEAVPRGDYDPRDQDTTMGPRDAADFISTAASDTMVCTKRY